MGGCINSETEVGVNPDGSGTVTETVYMSAMMQEMMQQMMQQMAAGFGGDANAKPSAEQPLDLAKFKKTAKTMGEGVTFVSAKRVTNAKGDKGECVVYKFTDITKLKINSTPNSPEQPGAAQAGEEKQIKFGFVKGATPKLIINFPKKEQAESIDTTATGKNVPDVSPPAKKPTPQEMAEFKKMFGGFGMSVKIKVNGNIVKTNAKHVKKGARCSTITLIDVNMDEVIDKMEDPAQLAEFMAMMQAKEMDMARNKPAEIPGMKFESSEKVEIQFK